MTCEEALILISGYLDQSNTEAEAAQLREHLEHCHACRAVLQAFEEADAGIRGLEEEPPADLADGVMARIAAENNHRRRKRFVRYGIAAAAALVCVLGLTTMELPAPASQQTAAPMAARSMPEEAIHDTPAYDSEAGFFYRDPSKRVAPQEIAETRGADLVVTYDLLPEMEVCACESMEDGSLLYILESKDSAAQLSKKYGVSLFQPENGSVSDVSYALLTYAE